MKTLISLTLVLASCAAVRINNQSSLPKQVVCQAYRDAKAIFVKTTKCSLPQDATLTIKDSTIKELNKYHNIFSYSGGAIFVSVAAGDFNPQTNTMRSAVEFPDRERNVFHESLHFLFHSVACSLSTADIFVEHAMIHEMEKVYFKQTNRPDTMPLDWLYKAVQGKQDEH